MIPGRRPKSGTIFIDMDGVIADLEGRLREHYPDLPNDITPGAIPDEQFWSMVKSIPRFWEDLPLMPGARRMVDFAKSHFAKVAILSAPSSKDLRSLPGKREWLDKHFPDLTERHFCRAVEKQEYSGPGRILVDDLASNCQQWRSKGGTAIQYGKGGAEEVIRRLGKLAPAPKLLVPMKKTTKNSRIQTYWINPAKA